MSLTNQSVLAVVFSDDRKSVLLVERRDIPVWVLPGGGIDPNETPEIAITREVTEETGYHVKLVRKVGEYEPINRLSKFTHVFECQVIEGTAKTSAETKSVQFHPIGSLPKRTPFPYQDWIEDGLKDCFIQKPLHKITYLTLARYLLTNPILVVRFLLARLGFSINT